MISRIASTVSGPENGRPASPVLHATELVERDRLVKVQVIQANWHGIPTAEVAADTDVGGNVHFGVRAGGKELSLSEPIPDCTIRIVDITALRKPPYGGLWRVEAAGRAGADEERPLRRSTVTQSW